MTDVSVRVKRGARGSFVISDVPPPARRKLIEALEDSPKMGALCHLTLPEKPKVKK
jgi:hypothetical protein